MDQFNLPQIAAGYMCFLFSICFHEMAHAWMAKVKGDRTAEMMGRLSMNPVVHADIIGTVLLPISAAFGNPFAFGWAKPVPVNERNLKNPKKDMFWVAIAGPLSNFFLATIGLLVLAGYSIWGQSITEGQLEFQRVVFGFIFINLMLGCFNLIPLHPLDGGKVLARFLPYEANRWLEERTMYLNYALIGLFVLGAFRFFGVYIQNLALYLLTGTEFLLRIVF